MLQQLKDIIKWELYLVCSELCVFLTVAEIGYVVVCCGGVGC